MDIGTDKVSKDIREKIPHWQIDIVNPDESYTAWQWHIDTKVLMHTARQTHKIPLIVWWTGLYIDTIYKNFLMPEVEPNEELRHELYKKEEETPWVLHRLLQEVDPASAQAIHPRSVRYIIRALEIFYATGKPKSHLALIQWPDHPVLMIWLRRNQGDNDSRIHARVIRMLENWLIEETKTLLSLWYTDTLQSMQGIWYRETCLYLNWHLSYDELIQTISSRTRMYAKRQRTRLRRYINDSETRPFGDRVTYRIYTMSHEIS
jgi:tRNA dimethylallyltransferase